jgi:hypothetical protein
LWVSSGDLEKRAAQELPRLLKIRDDSRITEMTAVQIIDREINKIGLAWNQTREASGKLEFQDNASVNVRLSFPVVVVLHRKSPTPFLKEVDTLEQMSAFWDEIASNARRAFGQELRRENVWVLESGGNDFNR